jgi:hypothetical protein
VSDIDNLVEDGHRMGDSLKSCGQRTGLHALGNAGDLMHDLADALAVARGKVERVRAKARWFADQEPRCSNGEPMSPLIRCILAIIREGREEASDDRR